MIQIEYQVCTLEQGKRLEKLGVKNSLYTWVYDNLNERFAIGRLHYEATELISRSHDGDYPEYHPAFTVVELTTAIGNGCVSERLQDGKYVAELKRENMHNVGVPCRYETQAIALAVLLVSLLERNYLKAIDVMKRLSHK